MTKGRKPKPDALHALAGNPGKRKRAPRAVKTERPVKVDEYSPPSHLSPTTKTVWKREMSRFLDAGYGRPSDLGAFAIYCQTLARHDKANRVLEAKGMTYEANGYVKKRPEVEIVQNCARLILAFQKALTLTTDGRLKAAAQLAANTRQGQLPLPDPEPRAAGAAPAGQTVKDDDSSPIGYLN